MVPSQDSNPRPVNRKSDALSTVQPRYPPATVPHYQDDEQGTDQIMSTGFYPVMAAKASNDASCTVCLPLVLCAIYPYSLVFFQAQLRQARVIPLLKKANMDPDTASSYRPISNLSYLSKLVEGVVTSRLKSHVLDFILLLVQQSTVCLSSTPLHWNRCSFCT